MTTPTLPEDLLHILTSATDTDVARRLLHDLLTPNELVAIGERWAIVKRLDEGKSQRMIRDEIGVSVTTVSRGNRQLKYGTGGFRAALDLLKQRE
jgi:TrpR family trp operon transcriptional repressor